MFMICRSAYTNCNGSAGIAIKRNAEYKSCVVIYILKTTTLTTFAQLSKLYYYYKPRHSSGVGHRLPTPAARVRGRVWSCGICGGQSGAEAGFLRVLRFPLPIFIPPIAPQSSSSGAGTIGQ
jgi:hypothetical protein